ncbi:hypothetical protein LSAT2_014873 [Lamellibrachia satsuma]|nr:hypothetical protein LSAT2_014873 [Lamellibrachia satsuma]
MAGFRMPTTQQRRLAESQKHVSLWRRHAQSVTACNLHRFDNLREHDVNTSSRHTLSKGSPGIRVTSSDPRRHQP